MARDLTRGPAGTRAADPGKNGHEWRRFTCSQEEHMRHRRVGWAAFAAALVLGAGALSAGAAAAALAGPVAAATAAGPATSCSAAAPVLLLTGDLAGPAAGGSAGACPGAILLVRHAGTAGPVVSLAMGGRRYLVPLAALGYLGRGLGLSLFDAGALAAAESGGRLPVRVASSYRVP